MTGNFEIETHWPVGPGPITIITSNDRQHSESESTVTVPVYYVTSNPKTLRIFKCSIVFYRYINILNSMGCQGRRPPGASGTVRPAFQFGRPGPAGEARKNPMIRWSSSSVTVAERSTGLLEPLIFALLVSL